METHDDVQVTIRVDKSIKESAEKLFGQLGMNMSTAINIFLRKAVSENAIPFSAIVKCHPLVADYTEDDITTRFQAAVQHEIAIIMQNGTPIARYDNDSKRAYLEYPDGTREYVNG